MRSVILSILVLGALAVLTPVGWSAELPPIARPYGGDADRGAPACAVDRESLRIPIDHLVLGSEHILDQQCHNGGFGWPHNDCSATFHNITAPILFGVLGTYYHTQDAIDLLGAVNGGVFELMSQFDNGEAQFGAFAPSFMLYLASASGNTTFSTFTTNEYFDELTAATYGPDDLDTAGWIAEVEAKRTGTWVNLRSWEFHNLIEAARILGQPGQDDLFEQAVLNGLDTLDNTDPENVYSDVIGLAGAVRGLAYARRFSFPPISAPLHPGVNGIDNLEDLAAYLASLQNPDGSWYWHSNLPTPTVGDESTQTTAYATLALLDVDVATAVSYEPATEAARNWLLSLQLPDGGFPSYPGDIEYTEVEGEALTAISAFDARLFVDGFESGGVGLWDSITP